MSLAAAPVYLWARSLASRGWALAAAALTLAVPGLAFSGLVMSEVEFYPLLTLSAWAMARALADPTPRRQAVLVTAVALATLTRLQGLVLLPVLAVAIAADAAFARSARHALRRLPALGGLVALLAAWLVVQHLRGEPLLGAYESVQSGNYGLGHAVLYVVYHAGDAVIASGVLPACALLVLAFTFVARGEASGEARATVATGVALASGLIVQVGVFASEHVGQLAERDLMCLLPTLFVCFALWLHRRGPRSYATASLAGIAVLAAVYTLPLKRLVGEKALPDAITLAPLWRLEQATSANTLVVAVLAGTAVLVALFALVPRRALPVLPALLLAAGIVASVFASTAAIDEAKVRRALLVGPDARWIDHAAQGPVTYLYDGRRPWPAVWQALFWNRRIAHVLTLDSTDPLPGPVPQRSLGITPKGWIDVRDAELVAPGAYKLAGTELVALPELNPGDTGTGLWQLSSPPTVRTVTSGLRANGDIWAESTASLVAYDCANGYWAITLLVKQPQTISFSQDGRPLRRLTYPFATLWRGQLPALPPLRPDRPVCELDITPSRLVGTTRDSLRFVRRG